MKRNKTIDTQKGLLIIIVILGHILGCTNYGNSNLMQFIYSFHMPFFIIISGFCTHKSSKRYWRSLITIYMSFLAFQILYGLIGYKSNFIDYFFQPKWILWYLFSLICWRIIIKLIPNNLIDTSFFLPISFLIGICSGYFPFSYGLSIQRTFSYFPFFCLGYTLQHSYPTQLMKTDTKWILLTITILIQIINIYILDTPMCILRGALNYTDCNIGLLAPFYRFFYYIAAIFTSYSLYNIIPQTKILSDIGKDSLLYYLYHGVFIVGFSIVTYKTSIEPNPFHVTSELIIIIVSIYILGKFKVARRLLRPINL